MTGAALKPIGVTASCLGYPPVSPNPEIPKFLFFALKSSERDPVNCGCKCASQNTEIAAARKPLSVRGPVSGLLLGSLHASTSTQQTK